MSGPCDQPLCRRASLPGYQPPRIAKNPQPPASTAAWRDCIWKQPSRKGLKGSSFKRLFGPPFERRGNEPPARGGERSRPDRWPLSHRSADLVSDPAADRKLAAPNRAAARPGCGFFVAPSSNRIHPLSQSEIQPPREAPGAAATDRSTDRSKISLRGLAEIAPLSARGTMMHRFPTSHDTSKSKVGGVYFRKHSFLLLINCPLKNY